MAEKFTNYLVSANYASNRTITIVPQQGASLTTSEAGVISAAGSRTGGSTEQLHSIYLTKSNVTSVVQNPESQGVILSVFVYDSTNNKEYYLAKAINVLPNSSFYIEKTITLRPQDALKIKFHSCADSSAIIDSVCSGVDLT